MARKLLFVLLLTLSMPSVCQANSPCAPSPTSNVADFYVMEVVPFRRTYQVERPLRVPLAQPVTREVSVLRLYVVIEEKDPAAAWFDALNNLWNAAAEGAAQEALRKIRTEGSPERKLFLERCTPPVERYMRENRIADRKVRYVTPQLEPQMADTGYRPLHSCTFIDERHRQMQARMYHRIVTEQKREWDREIGNADISFRLIVEGNIDDRAKGHLRFDVVDLVVEPRLTTADTDSHIVNLKTTALRLEAEAAVAETLARLRGTYGNLVLSDQAQRQLCPGRDGRTAIALGFSFQDEQLDAQIVLTSRHHRVVREALGQPAPEDALPVACRRINCDCPAVYNFMGVWRKECYDVERALRAKCSETGSVTGHCHATMHGPKAWP